MTKLPGCRYRSGWYGPQLGQASVCRSARVVLSLLTSVCATAVFAVTPEDAEVQARCNLVFSAVAPAGMPARTYATVDADTLPSTLEAVLPYCGVKVMWYLTGQRIASDELDVALRWFLLARARTLLERMVDPRAFADAEQWRYKRLERIYGTVLEPYRLDNPSVEREALRRALGWDRLYPSIAWPPADWPGLHAEMRARLQRRLDELETETASHGQ